MRLKIVASLALVFAFCIAGMAEAQQRQRGNRGAGVSRTALIQVEAVQKELEVSDEQKTELEGLRGNRQRGGEGEPRRQRGEGQSDREGQKRERGQRGERGNRGAARGQGGQGRTLDQVQAEVDALSEILLPHQVTRLNEIYVQVLGQRAIQDPVIASELKITDDQEAEMQEIRDESRETMRETMQELRDGGDREAMREKMTELAADVAKQMMSVLTDEQNNRLNELKGEAFDMPEDAMPQGRRRGRQRSDF